MNTKIEQEVKIAYGDCWEGGVSETRNLSFRASEPVDKAEAIRIMSIAVPSGYNEFEAKVLEHLPDDAQITLAREGSVCVYVTSKSEIVNHAGLLADEFDPCDDETRIWWN